MLRKIDWPQATIVCVGLAALAAAVILAPEGALRGALEALAAVAALWAGGRARGLLRHDEAPEEGQ